MSTLHALALDVETTGLDPHAHAVVELAAIGVRIDPATGQYDACRALFATLVDPGRAIPPAASAVHHITDRDVQGQPCLAAALDNLQAAVCKFRPTVMVAHHAAFDSAFLPDLAATLTPDDPRWVCTQRLAQHLWPLAEGGFGLQTLRYACGLQDHVDGIDTHRAAFDAACCAVLLAAECRALVAAGHDVTPALLRDWTAKAPLLARVPFGRRHRGWLWRYVPRDYLEWILRTHQDGNPFDPAVVATAEAALRGVYAVPPEQPEPCAHP